MQGGFNEFVLPDNPAASGDGEVAICVPVICRWRCIKMEGRWVWRWWTADNLALLPGIAPMLVDGARWLISAAQVMIPPQTISTDTPAMQRKR